jgi:membrane fusion protein, multidrug efflux system
MIAISNPLRLFVKVPQPFAAGIPVGAPVTVHVRQYPGRDFAGRITRSAGALDAATRTLNVEAQVANDEGELIPGGYAEVTFPAPLAHGITVIPASAAIVDAQGVHVATVDAHSKVHLIPVQIGRDQGQNVEIVHGLTGQESVIASPASNVVDGMRVAVNPSAATATPGP